jgi:hypothetical protein
MKFLPCGPFDLRNLLRSEDYHWRKNFWAEIEERYEGLDEANGVYVFSTRYGGNYTPWYVGKTCSDKGFAGEVFQDHKLDHYFEASNGKRARPMLHLIAHVTQETDRFSKWSKRSESQIERLETYLIGMALGRNPDLRNNQKTRFFRDLDIKGVIGPNYSGRPREDAQTLKNALGIAFE